MQYFLYLSGNHQYVFSTMVNAEGQYSVTNDNILGTVHNINGNRIETTRVPWTSLRPMTFKHIKSIFPDFTINENKETWTNDEVFDLLEKFNSGMSWGPDGKNYLKTEQLKEWFNDQL